MEPCWQPRPSGIRDMSFTQSFRRSLKILFIDRRLPWIITQVPSLIAQVIFQIVPVLSTRTCKKQGLHFEYRPATPDLQVLREVIDCDEYQVAQTTIGTCPTVIDIGAHLGSFAVLAASQAPKGIVFSYEPDPANFRLLTRNVARNGLANVRTFKCAVAATSGPKTLFRATTNWGHSLSSRAYSRRLVIDSVTLPQIFETNDVKTCHLLKIDCEGSEYEILMGLSPELLGRIERIVGEWHPAPAGPKALGFRHLGEFLEAHGFLVEPDPRTADEIPQGVFQAVRPNSN
jgi:FkbM family methyltransferase